MARILAIDYGKKRTGIAVSDPLRIIANGLTTVDTKELFSFLKTYSESENRDTLFMTMPKSLKNQDTDATPLVEKFIEQFVRTFPSMPISTLDERFTSKMAFQTMIDAGLGKKARQNKALVDEISATILLQSYMLSL